MKTVGDILSGITEFRHQLHRIPELAGNEVETSRMIRARLEDLGLELRKPFLGTDVVAILHGGRGPGKNVTLRADIDALLIDEATKAPYTSTHPGKMHACGHDGHTAMAVGAAELLAARRDEFSGSVRFVFQPGEENRAMGRELVAAGALENPKADLVTALHGMPGLPVGMLATRTGAIMGSCAHFKVTVKGRGGHSSRPDVSIDPVLAAAAMVVEAQSVVSRRINPQQPAVLSVCRIAGGQLANVIPDETLFEGTARSLSPEVDLQLEQGLRDVVEHVGAAHRVTGRIEYRLSYPVTVNAPEPTGLARQVIRETFGTERYTELAESSMGAEDFAYYLQKYPGVYVKLGTGESCPALHNAEFDFPDAALATGIEYLVNFALAGLR